MTLEEIENELIKLGTDINNSDCFLKLANTLANYYDNSFPNKKLKSLFQSSNSSDDSIKNMRVDLANLPLSNKEHLEFSDKFILKLDDSSYIVINLKGITEEVVLNGERVYFNHRLNVSEIYELLDAVPYTYDKNSYFDFLYSLYITSLIYKYAYFILESKATDKNGYTKAGMFKNAYFDIIELCEHVKKSELEL